MKKINSIFKFIVFSFSIAIAFVFIYMASNTYMKGTNGAVVNIDDSTFYKPKQIDSIPLIKIDSINFLRAFSSKSLVIQDEIYFENLKKMRWDFVAKKKKLRSTKDSSNTWIRASSSKSLVISPDMIKSYNEQLDERLHNIHLLQNTSKSKMNNLLDQTINSFLYTGLSLLLLVLIFIPLEKVFPITSNQKILRKKWILDLCYFLGQYLIWNYLVLQFLSYFEIKIHSLTPNSIKEFIVSQPFYLQCIEVVLLSDVLLYWAHRWQHHSSFLWRFHKVHHSSETMDWLASHREHPVDTLYTLTVVNLPAILMGFSLSSIAFLVIFRGVWAIYIHSNINLNVGVLKYIFGSPQLHHWHHDINKHKGNYANVSPLMDILFGTYYEQKDFPENYGIEEKIPQNYFKQLIEPLLPKRFFVKKK